MGKGPQSFNVHGPPADLLRHCAHTAHKSEFIKNFECYNIHDVYDNRFQIEDIELAMSKLKKGKAAGVDGVC